MASFLSFFYVSFAYGRVRPTHPDSALGLVYKFKMTRPTVYLPASVAMRVDLLQVGFIVGFSAAFIIVPKWVTTDWMPTVRGLQRMTFVTHSLGNPSTKQYAALFTLVAVFFLFFYFAGPAVADWAIALGVRPWNS